VGYDRVMAYKFHEDYHGEIIAEVREPGLEPFIGYTIQPLISLKPPGFFS